MKNKITLFGGFNYRRFLMVMPRKYGKGYRAVGDYGEFEVLEYVSKKEVLIRFTETGYETTASANNVAKGKVKDPFRPNVWGIGYLGNAKASYKDNGKIRLKVSYNTWSHMLRRCYGFAAENVKTYQDCSVCDEWLCFENYEKWFDENYIESYHVDKDLKVIGNRIYSPETCVFIPPRINTILGFKTYNSVRKDGFKHLPVGVSWHKRDLVYTARCWDEDKLVSLGYHHTPEAAFYEYKNYKEAVIKRVSKKYYDLGLLDKIVYENLQRYTVTEEGHSFK